MTDEARRRARALFAPSDDVVMGDPGGQGPNEKEVAQAIHDAVTQARNEEAAAHADCCVDREEIAQLVEGGWSRLHADLDKTVDRLQAVLAILASRFPFTG